MPRASSRASESGKEKKWSLRLYVAGEAPGSVAALHNLQKICREYVNVGCNIEVIDVQKDPRVAIVENIVALPTLVRKVPGDRPRRMIGDLSDTQKVLKGLGLAEGN